MNIRKLMRVLAPLPLLLAAAGTVQAHHSFAMYDQEQLQMLTGRLTRYIPGANHAQLLFELLDADGNPVYQQMDASALVPVMWAEIQSLRQRLAAAGI